MSVSWMEGLTTAGASAETPSTAWLRFRAGPGAAKISLQPGLCAQAEATCPKHLLVLLILAVAEATPHPAWAQHWAANP